MNIINDGFELVPVGQLREHDRNPRQGDTGAIFQSIEANGFYGGIVAQKSSRKILVGNHRFRAAIEAGAEAVPVHWVDCDDDRALRIMLADNRANDLACYDDPALAKLLEEIVTQTGTLDGTLFDGDALDAIRADLGEAPFSHSDGEDDVPETPLAPVSQLGDLWLLGEHRVLCGDSIEKDCVARLCGQDRADLVFTDPPYGVDYDGGTVIRKKLAGDDSTALYAPCCLHAAKFSTDEAALYLWHAGVKGIAAAAAAAAAGYEIRCELIWNKNLAQFGSLSAQYKQKHEPCYYCFKRGNAPAWYGPTNEVTVWDCDRSSVNEFHPTQKPVSLAERAIKNSSESGNQVLDLFLGSGSTLIACEKTGRRCLGMELAPEYIDVICKRWQDFTGKEATLDGVGATFAHVAEGRLREAKDAIMEEAIVHAESKRNGRPKLKRKTA